MTTSTSKPSSRSTMQSLMSFKKSWSKNMPKSNSSTLLTLKPTSTKTWRTRKTIATNSFRPLQSTRCKAKIARSWRIIISITVSASFTCKTTLLNSRKEWRFSLWRNIGKPRKLQRREPQMLSPTWKRERCHWSSRTGDRFLPNGDASALTNGKFHTDKSLWPKES